MRIAVCSGSFDPITKGHLDIIKRAANLFDKLIVVVAINGNKKSTFTIQERLDFIKRSTVGLENVEIDSFRGLLIDYVNSVNACAIVRGLRAVSDFEYEFQMALTNKKLNPSPETIFLTASSENMFLSSSIVKQIVSLGGDITEFVPTEILDDINSRLYKTCLEIEN